MKAIQTLNVFFFILIFSILTSGCAIGNKYAYHNPPITQGLSPPENGTGIALSDNIVLHVLDNRTDDEGVDIGTIQVTVGGITEQKSKAELLSYLQGLPALQSKKVLSGQQIAKLNEGFTPDPYNDYLDIPLKSRGLNAAILGSDLEYVQYAPATQDRIATLIEHYRKGGIVTLTWHAVNPSNNVYGHIGDAVVLSNVYTAGHTEYTNLRTQMDNVAGAIQQFEDAGIPVIFRPLHEMNGYWFWWGTQSGTSSEFIALWRYVHDYMVTTKGLTNILWAYSPSSSAPPDKLGGQTDRYPGSAYVDFVGIDYYSEDGRFYALGDYASLKALGKPFVFGELGQQGGQGPYTARDAGTIITDIKNNLPDTIWFEAWWGIHSITGRKEQGGTVYGNWGVDVMFRDPWIISREDLPSGHTYTCASGLTCTGSSGDYTVTLSPKGGTWADGEVVYVVVNATDLAGNVMDPKRYSFTTSGTPATLTISTTSLTGAKKGTSYFQTLFSTGGVSPKTWDNTAPLPEGLSIPSTGTGSWGVPTVEGTFTIAFRVTDGAASTATKSLSLIIAPLTPSGQGTVKGSIIDTYIDIGGVGNGDGNFRRMLSVRTL